MSDSNILTEALEVFADTKADMTPEFNDLYEIYLAAELGGRTKDIITILATEPNQHPYTLLSQFLAIEDQATIQIEVGQSPVIMARAIDRRNQEAGSIDMSPSPKSAICEKITQGTFEKLSKLRITLDDKRVARSNVQERMKTAI